MPDDEIEEVTPELDETTGDPEDDEANSQQPNDLDVKESEGSTSDNPPIQEHEEAGMGS